MRRATVPLAIVQADIAAQALAGEGVFAAMAPFGNLRALGSLFPEALHIVVRADSPVVSLKDLAGKRIALGPPGSGSRVTAEQVLEAQGLRRGQDYILDESPFTASLGALASGSVDAVIQMIGLPADQARAAAAAGRFKLVSLDEDIIQPLTGPGSALFPGVIPKGTYPGVDVDIRTLSVAALMTTTTALSESEVTMLMRAVFGQGNDLLGAGSSQGGQIGVSNARTGLTIPLAPGAEAALAELGAGQ
jgi:TRAP transporter TAXI family solute receptor